MEKSNLLTDKNTLKVDAIHNLLKGADFNILKDGTILTNSKIKLTNKQIEIEILNLKQLRSIETKTNNIAEHIYRLYPKDKQAQDQVSESYSKTVLLALTQRQLHTISLAVYKAVININKGLEPDRSLVTKLDDGDIKVEVTENFDKLIKVGLRVAWLKSCIKEGKLAIAENREPNYSEFPKGGN